MKIGFYKLGLDDPVVRTIFAGMYSSFFNALQKVGFDTKLIFDFEFKELDILVVPFGEGQEKESAKAIDKFNGPIIVYTTPANNWFNLYFLGRWSHRILFVYSTDASNYSCECYKQVGLAHLHLPFGSDETIFCPLQVPKIYDIIFIANAWSGTGRDEYIDLLVKKANKKNWKIMLFGGGWEKYGFSQQLIGHGELLNLIYNSSKININIFNNEQNLGTKLCLDANNRLFDLALAECFQTCNAPEIVNNYFSKNEVISVKDPVCWLEKIEFYLENEEQRKCVAQSARKRALKDHTWINRAIEFKKFLSNHLPNYGQRQPDHSISSYIYRKIDCSLPSTIRIQKKVKKAIKKISL